MIKGVIFDFDGALVREGTSAPATGIPELIAGLHARGITVGAMSGQTGADVSGRVKASGLAIDALITRDIPNAAKGGGHLIARFGTDAGFDPEHVAAVVSDEQGFRETINAPVISFRAGWANFNGKYSLRCDTPAELLEYLDLFFMKQHHWFASYDGIDSAGREIRLRALIDGRGAGSTAIKNAIIDALKNKTDREIGGASFSRILVMHLIASMYLEGLLSDKRTAASCVIYPGHSITSTPPPLIEAALQGLKFVRMSINHDALSRWSNAVHSSRSRYEQQHAKVLFSNQPSTIFIPQKYKTNGKRIFVLDDFTTDGFSLENARNMLLQDGAERVTMIAFGKYPKPHTVAVPRPAGVLRPRVQQAYTDANFALGSVNVPADHAALAEFVDLVGKIVGSTIGPKLLT